MSDPAPAPQRRLFRYEQELSAEEVAELDELLPAEVIAHHLRRLATGEGAPWPESSG
jgi:hypothetical protein